MPSQAFVKWGASMLLFLLVSSGTVDPAHEDSIRGVLELAVSSIVFFFATFIYGYEIIHKLKHPTDGKENTFVIFLKNMLGKVFVVTPKDPPPPAQ